MKRRLCILLAMMMVVCLLPMTVTVATSTVWDGTIATAYAGGTGTGLDPYQISNGQQLAYLAQQANAGTNYSGQYFVLTNDIVLNDTTDWETWDTTPPTNWWTPIGTNANPFAGTFDGGNHIISGVYVCLDGFSAGLFGQIGLGSVIQNVGVIDSYLEGQECSGAIAGRSSGSIINCYNTGTVIGSHAGGIWGGSEGYASRTVRCWNEGTVTGTFDAGGIAGTGTFGPSFEYCYNEGAVTTSGGNAGGIVGSAFEKEIISNCYNAGPVSAQTTAYAGGIAGAFANSTMEYCYNVGSVSGPKSQIGMIAAGSISNAVFISSYYLNNDLGTCAIGSYIDYSSTPELTTYNIDLAGTVSLTDSQMQTQPNFKDWDFINAWTIEGGADYPYPTLRNMPSLPNPDTDSGDGIWDGSIATAFAGGTGTELDPYIIMTPKQLAYFRDQVNGGRTFEGEYVKVGANLSLNDTTDWETWSDTVAPENTWEPIGLNTNRFAGTFDGDNHTISGMYINVQGRYAGLFGYTNSVSIIKNFGIKDSYVMGNTESTYAGAIAGYSNGAVLNCYNTGTVVGYYAGGICGRGGGMCSVINCGNEGIILGSSYAGGIAGRIKTQGSFKYCYNKGTVTVSGAGGYGGGIVGYNDIVRVENCYNEGRISVQQETGFAGGIAGYLYARMDHSYNAGSVTGGVDKTGLIAGRATNQDVISCTYYLNDATTLCAIGEYVDRTTAPYTLTYNQNPAGTAPLTAGQMQARAYYMNWDFDNVWTMEDDSDYPYPKLRIPVTTKLMTTTTLGGAARIDKTAIRFGASISFANLTTLDVGDTVDYGFNINGLRNDALTNANWTKLSAASTTVNFAGFEWTAEMDAATTTEALTAAIRATGIKVYQYGANTITFAIIINNLPAEAQDSLWVFEPYVTINATETSLGEAKYNSINRILEDIASSTYVA